MDHESFEDGVSFLFFFCGYGYGCEELAITLSDFFCFSFALLKIQLC